MIEVIAKSGNLFVIKIVMREVHSMDIPNLRENLMDAIVENEVKKLVVDLSDVNMITSSGIGVFFHINQILESRFCLAGVNAEVKKVLDLTKVSSIIRLFPAVDDAIAFLK